MENEAKRQYIDLVIVITLFIIACLVGKLSMMYISDTWLGFNIPALSILAPGELLWTWVKKRVLQDNDNKSKVSV